jgi:hypothetical protein
MLFNERAEADWSGMLDSDIVRVLPAREFRKPDKTFALLQDKTAFS